MASGSDQAGWQNHAIFRPQDLSSSRRQLTGQFSVRGPYSIGGQEVEAMTLLILIRAGVVAVLVAAGLSLTWMKAPEVAAQAGQKMCTAATGNAFAQTIAVPSTWTILDCSEWVMTAAGMSPSPKMRVRLGCVFPDGSPTKFSWSDPPDGFMPVCGKTPLPGQYCSRDDPGGQPNSHIPKRNCGWTDR